MQYNKYGKLRKKISLIGLGTGQIGDYTLSEKKIDYFLNEVLDLGVNFIDTARGYGLAEERIGKYLKNRRKEFILSTKVGYGVEKYEDWTYDCVIKGIDRALKLMKTDHLDIVHLHSCDSNIMKNNAVIDALLKCVETGKVKVPAYSGENEDLDYAIECGKFGGLMFSLNITDQRAIDKILPNITTTKAGIIIKRPLANAFWKYNDRPYGEYAEEYWHRWHKMFEGYYYEFGMSMTEVAVRFVVSQKGISNCVFGSKNIYNIKEIIKFAEKGPLPEVHYNTLREKFQLNDINWKGEI